MQPILCSGRFVRAFLEMLAPYPELESEIEHLSMQPLEQCIELERAHDLVHHWVNVTGDIDLGLRAGRASCIGSGGPLDYALHSAHSLRQSILLAQRYAQVFRYELQTASAAEGERAVLKLESRLPWPRAVADFALSTAYRNHLRPHLGDATDLQCWFSYPQPESIEKHERVFEGVTLIFDAPFNAFVFDARVLDRLLTSADPLLHTAHCEHLDSVFNAMAGPQALAMRVRRLIAAELQQGRPKSSSVARKLRMSRRTLVRRLEAEGTSFSLQLDDLRRQLGLRFVSMRTMPLGEITSLLGFSHVQGFHRAFKRWTGQTPLHYREEVREDSSGSADSSLEVSLLKSE